MNAQMTANEGNVMWRQGSSDPSPVRRYWPRNIRFLTWISNVEFFSVKCMKTMVRERGRQGKRGRELRDVRVGDKAGRGNCDIGLEG